MKEIKELLKDPKKKSLIQLFLYFIFFVFVFIVFNSSESVNTEKIIKDEKTSFEKYRDMYGYIYKVTYTSLDKVDIIEGTYYKNKSVFNFNNLKYYYDDGTYIIDNNSYYLSNIEYDITKVFNINLYNIINGLEIESTTTFKDGTVIKNYSIDSNIIYQYLYNINSNFNNLVYLSITENNNEIYNITFDLTNLGLSLNKIEIQYSYMNLITGLDFNKDFYTQEENL